MEFPRQLYVSLILVVACVFSQTAFSAFKDPLDVKLPELEVVSGAQWYWAGRHLAVNNIPMSVKLFSYPGKAEEVERFYLGLWQIKGHGKLTQKSIGDLNILGYQLDGFQYSVQFSQQGNVVDGKIVVSPTPLNYKERKKTTLPLPPRAKIASVVQSLEMGKRSESVTLDTSLGVAQVLDFYRVQLQSEGWQQYSGSGDGVEGAVVSFQRGGELLQLNIKGLQGRNSSF
ncbi:MAG: hypothetical protein ACPGZU_06675, partial [Ketobacter sp.]